MIVTSFQYSKLCKKQISQTFSYCEQINSLRNGAIDYSVLLIRKCWRNLFFCEAWSPEMTSQSFPVSCFLVSQFCTPLEVKFDAFGTLKHGEGKSLSKNFLLYLSAHWGDLIEQIKKNLSYTL